MRHDELVVPDPKYAERPRFAAGDIVRFDAGVCIGEDDVSGQVAFVAMLYNCGPDEEHPYYEAIVTHRRRGFLDDNACAAAHLVPDPSPEALDEARSLGLT